MITTVYLHENARPPSAADAQSQRCRPLPRKVQKRSSMPVVQARSGSSIVISPPWAIRFGLRAKSQAARAMALGP